MTILRPHDDPAFTDWIEETRMETVKAVDELAVEVADVITDGTDTLQGWVDEATPPPPMVLVSCLFCADTIREATQDDAVAAMDEHVHGHSTDELNAPVIALSQHLTQQRGDMNILAVRTVNAERYAQRQEGAAIEARRNLLPMRKIVEGVEELVRQARAVSPGDGMTVYVNDLERLLGLDRKVMHKLGQNEQEPADEVLDADPTVV